MMSGSSMYSANMTGQPGMQNHSSNPSTQSATQSHPNGMTQPASPQNHAANVVAQPGAQIHPNAMTQKSTALSNVKNTPEVKNAVTNIKNEAAALNIIPTLPATAPYDSLVTEDKQLLNQLGTDVWDIHSNIRTFWELEDLAFKRGYLNSLVYLATNYGALCTPREEKELYTPDPMVAKALNVIAYTNSPILIYVAEHFIDSIKSSDFLGESARVGLHGQLDEAKEHAWILKTAADVPTEFLSLITKIGTPPTPKSNSTTATTTASTATASTVSSATTTDHHHEEHFHVDHFRVIEGLLNYNTLITNAIVQQAFNNTVSYIKTALTASNIKHLMACMRLGMLLAEHVQNANAQDTTREQNKTTLLNLGQSAVTLIKQTNAELAEKLQHELDALDSKKDVKNPVSNNTLPAAENDTDAEASGTVKDPKTGAFKPKKGVLAARQLVKKAQIPLATDAMDPTKALDLSNTVVTPTITTAATSTTTTATPATSSAVH